MGEQNTKDSKKPYTPPQFTVISLRPEEAVLGACKTMSHPGPGGSNCFSTGQNCTNSGS